MTDQPSESAGPRTDMPAHTPAVPAPLALLAGCMLTGFLIEALLHGERVGLGFALAGLITVVGCWLLGRRQGVRPGREAVALMGYTLFLSAMIAVRASSAVRVLDTMVIIGTLLVVAFLYRANARHPLSVSDLVVAVLTGALASLFGPILMALFDLPARVRAPGPRRAWRPVLSGLLLAVPVLLLFGALFYSADAVFADYVRRIFDWQIDLQDLIKRLILSLLFGWLALGLARHAFAARDSDWSLPLVRPGWLTLPATAVITVLALVILLFGVFIAIQAVYLFGGADTLARTGVSYSEYARQGFFELVMVAALVLSLILLLDWLTTGAPRAARRAIHLLHGLLVALTMAVLVSALQRMRLYQAAYGLTELRFYTTAFMLWLGAVLAWLAGSVLMLNVPSAAGEMPGRRRFAMGAFIMGLGLVALLNLANPDAIIARANLARVRAGADVPLDATYLTSSLSADAVPTLLQALPGLADDGARVDLKCGLAVEASRLESDAATRSWRGAIYGVERARRLLAADSLLAPPADNCRD